VYLKLFEYECVQLYFGGFSSYILENVFMHGAHSMAQKKKPHNTYIYTHIYATALIYVYKRGCFYTD
jgi:hypothetical protein